MSRIGNRAAILTLSRLANYGLMLISPVVLVRLLDVAQFGRYREFLLYGSVLQSFAAFSINDSLLYCLPSQPQSPWRVARQTALLTAASSALVVIALVIADLACGRTLVGDFLLPLAAYTLLSVNLDFWEFFWLAQGRPGRVFLYSGVRLMLRVAVATGVAAWTHDVEAIIWALVAFEGARLLASAIAMWHYDTGGIEPPLFDPWRDQLRFCVPSGLASLLAMFSRNLSNLVVARALGAVALAQYSIGRFGEPVVVTLRNSVSSVVLPEMVRQERRQALELWRRATVVNAILLFPVVVVVVRFAQPLIATVFGADYLPATPIMQLYMAVVVRECFDFAPALRAINRTRPLVESNLLACIVGTLGLLVLIPRAGLTGAMLAMVIAAWTDALYLAWRTMSAYHVRLRGLVPWSSIGKTALAALLGGTLLLSPAWSADLGFAGVLLGSAFYVGTFALLLLGMRVPEAQVLWDWLKRLPPRRPSQAHP